MLSILWLFLAFVVGAYAGAIAVAVMSISARQEQNAAEAAVKRLGDGMWRREHGTIAQH
jgi:hypothetical protein